MAANADTRARYGSQLEYELDVIAKMGFPGYFLIVADFIQWAKANDIPVGPGRGSGAGSVAAATQGKTTADQAASGSARAAARAPARWSPGR